MISLCYYLPLVELGHDEKLNQSCSFQERRHRLMLWRSLSVVTYTWRLSLLLVFDLCPYCPTSSELCSWEPEMQLVKDACRWSNLSGFSWFSIQCSGRGCTNPVWSAHTESSQEMIQMKKASTMQMAWWLKPDWNQQEVKVTVFSARLLLRHVLLEWRRPWSLFPFL